MVTSISSERWRSKLGNNSSLMEGNDESANLFRSRNEYNTTASEVIHHSGAGVELSFSVIAKRGVFKWLPVRYDNDLVHGSWWFVYGSLLATITAIIPLLAEYYSFFNDESEDALSHRNAYKTWTLLIISGVLYSFGAYAFTRAFKQPPPPALFGGRSFLLHSDELVGAWLFCLGTAPYVPYCLVFYHLHPHSVFYSGAVVGACVCLLATFLFVLACLPTTTPQARRNYIKQCFQRMCGRQNWLILHVQTDWLAGSWGFLIACVELCVGSGGLLVYTALHSDANKNRELFFYSMSWLDALLFSIGAAYFVAGSYPIDRFRCYREHSAAGTRGGDENGDGDSTYARQRGSIEPLEVDMQLGLIADA